MLRVAEMLRQEIETTVRLLGCTTMRDLTRVPVRIREDCGHCGSASASLDSMYVPDRHRGVRW